MQSLKSLKATLGAATYSEQTKLIIENLNQTSEEDVDKTLVKLKAVLESYIKKNPIKNSNIMAGIIPEDPPWFTLCKYFITAIELHNYLKTLKQQHIATPGKLMDQDKRDELAKRIGDFNIFTAGIHIIIGQVSDNPKRVEFLQIKKRNFVMLVAVRLQKLEDLGFVRGLTIARGGRRSATRRKLNKRGNKKTRRH